MTAGSRHPIRHYPAPSLLPARYFQVETPLAAVADLIGCSGYVEFVISRTEAWQEANRIGYPATYRKPATKA